MMDQTRGGEDEIIGKILDDGRARAKRILDNAERTVESEKRKAQAEADKVRKEILDKAMRKVAAVKSKEVAAAHVEAKRALLRAREEAISAVFDRIEEALGRLHRNKALYRKALLNLAVEAVRAIGDSDVTLIVGDADADLAGSDFVSEVEGKLVAEGLRGVTLHVEVGAAAAGGGCIARSADSRIIFDNTFSRRLERMRPSLRSTIVNEVLKSDA